MAEYKNKKLMVEVRDGNYNIVSFINRYTSLIWRNDTFGGDCELCLPYEDGHRTLFQTQRFLRRMDNEQVCIITKLEIKYDALEGRQTIVTGESLFHLFKRRVFRTFTTAYYKNTKNEYITSLLHTSAGADYSYAGVNAFKTFDNSTYIFSIDSISIGTDYINCNGEENQENAFDYFKNKFNEWGVKCQILNTAGLPVKIRMLPYQNRTGVVFTETNRNVKSSNLCHDLSPLKTATYGYVQNSFGQQWHFAVGTSTHSSVGLFDQWVNIEFNDNYTQATAEAEIKHRYSGYVNMRYEIEGDVAYLIADYPMVQVVCSEHETWIQNNVSTTHYFYTDSTTGLRFCYINQTDVRIGWGQLKDSSATTVDSTQQYNIYTFYLSDQIFMQLTAALVQYDAEWTNTMTIDADDNKWTLWENYDVGDKVSCIFIDGTKDTMLVSEAVETWDADGYNVDITLEKQSTT